MPRRDHKRAPFAVRTAATRNPSNFNSYRQPPGQALSSGTASAERARAGSTGPASPRGSGCAAAIHSGCAGYAFGSSPSDPPQVVVAPGNALAQGEPRSCILYSSNTVLLDQPGRQSINPRIAAILEDSKIANGGPTSRLLIGGLQVRVPAGEQYKGFLAALSATRSVRLLKDVLAHDGVLLQDPRCLVGCRGASSLATTSLSCLPQVHVTGLRARDVRRREGRARSAAGGGRR